MFDQFHQDTQAVGDSLFLTAMCALIPLAVLFVLLGGLKVRVGSRLYDASLRSKLDSLRFALKRA